VWRFPYLYGNVLLWNSSGMLTTRFTRRGTKVRIIGSAEWREFRRRYREEAKNP